MTADIKARYLDVAAAAIYLGRTEQSLYSLCARRKIPHHRQGSRIFFDQLDLDAWMRIHRVEAS